MEREKITIINGELYRVSTGRRNEVSDAIPLLPSNNRSIIESGRSYLHHNLLGISVISWIIFLTWISIAATIYFFKNSVLKICFHLLTFFISLMISEFARISLAYQLSKDNFDESERLKTYFSLDPRMLISNVDTVSLVTMILTFFILGMPMLSINQVVDYDKLSSNWKKSTVAFSGPFSYFIFGGLLALIHNIGVLFFQDNFFKGSISESLLLGIYLLAFLTIINILPLPPITDGFRIISPYLPERINSEISSARRTLLFFILCTVLFVLIAQSELVKRTVEFLVVDVYRTTRIHNKGEII